MGDYMTIAEMRATVSAMAERYRQHELEGMRVLPHRRELEQKLRKPRIRVKAGSTRWSLSAELSCGIAGQ